MNSTEASTTSAPSTSPFNQNPGMEFYEVIILLVFYGIVCLAILALNYLIMRAFLTSRSLLPRQRFFLSFLAFADFTVGLVSIPTFLYNMSHWPSYGFYIYEASDCASGFASSCILVDLSIQALHSTFKAPTRYADYPRRRNFCLVIMGSTFLSGGAAALNVACLMDYIPFAFYFYLAAGFLAVSVLIMAVTCIILVASQLCGKTRESDREEDKNVKMSLMKSCIVYILAWALPCVFFTYHKFCGFCISFSPMGFYILRMVLYLKSFVMPIFYFYNINSFRRVLRKIITKDCLAVPRKY